MSNSEISKQKEIKWRKWSRDLDREEEAVTDAMIGRFGPEAVDLIVAAREGLNRAAQLYEDLESLAAEVSAKDQQVEFSQALEQIRFWSWGLSGVEDTVRSRVARGSERGAEHPS